MAKKKAPARKGGAKKAAPTKGAKKRTVPELRKAAKARMDDHSDKRKFDALSGTLSIHQDGVELGSVQVPVVDNGVNVMLSVPGAASLAKIAEPTLFLGKQVVFAPGEGAEVFGAALVKPKPKFWTRFQSAKTGRFVSACAAMADKARTFGRRVLRKPQP